MPPGFAYKTRYENSDGYASLFLMNVHYSGAVQGIDSKSGVIVKYIEKSNYILQQAHTFVLVASPIRIPPGQKSYDICIDHLISQHRTSLVVFSHRIHQHTSGVEIYTKIFRDGMFVGMLGKESAKKPQIFRHFPLRVSLLFCYLFYSSFFQILILIPSGERFHDDQLIIYVSIELL